MYVLFRRYQELYSGSHGNMSYICFFVSTNCDKIPREDVFIMIPLYDSGGDIMIRKIEQIAVGSIPPQKVHSDSFTEMIRKCNHELFRRHGALIFIIGFLLGRAVIVGELMPFAIPFVAVLYHVRRDKVFIACLAVLSGALTHQVETTFTIFIGIVLFVLIQKLFERSDKGDLFYTTLSVFTAVLLSNLLVAFVLEWTGYILFMASIEASFSLVLTFIFVQSIPLLTAGSRTWRQSLKNEELVCLIILLASIMSGTVGWLIMGLSIEHIMSRYVILVFALAAGGAVGATVGVVTGIILTLANVQSIPEMSLLAFSGLLGGLLKEGKKIGVATGLLIGTLLMGLYVSDGGLLLSFQESLVAIAMLFLTPKSVFRKISQYIPGTQEYAHVQQDYMKRLRNVTSHKVNQFSQLFEHLSQSFSEKSDTEQNEKNNQIDQFLSQVTEHTCQVCFKKEKCWQDNFDETYSLMNELFDSVELYGDVKKPQLINQWTRHCIKSKKTIQLMKQEIEQYKTYLSYKKKLNESKRLVADQLSGVSQVMDNFAQEIKREGEVHHVQEQQLLDALEGIGLNIYALDIISLDEGGVEIEVTQPFCADHDQCGKIIGPLFSNIIGEGIEVAEKTCQKNKANVCHMRFVSAQHYHVQAGVASVAKGGGIVSGDCSSTMEIGHGKFAVAIADGMGNGERAHIESNETLHLLQHILQSGIEETVAIKSINSVLSLRSTEEMFSTLDLAMIDLQTAKTKFIKIGSTPSFIKRSHECISIAAHNLPIGILQNIEVDVVSEQLKPDDLLIMVTDGIYDAPVPEQEKEATMKKMIAEIETNQPQEVADLLLEKVIRSRGGYVLDDMTVVVAKIEQNTPDWSTISQLGLPQFRV